MQSINLYKNRFKHPKLQLQNDIKMKPTLPSITLLTILVSGLILVSNIDSCNSATGVTGRIDSDASWTKAGSPYTLTGNVLVSKGVTLTIEAGATVNLNDYLMMINGTLRAKGANSDMIQFNGGTITITEASSSWNQATGAGCIIEYASFNGRLSVSGSPKISSCSFQTVGIGGNAVFSNNVVNEQASISGSPTISGNTFNGVVRVNSDTGTPFISSNSMSGGLSISYQATLPTISHNTITGGVTVEGAESVLIDSNQITGAVTISSGNGTLSNNNIKGTITIGSEDFKISNNVISETDVGITFTPDAVADSLGATITGNTIKARQTGISVPPSLNVFLYGWDTRAIVSGNTFMGCASAGIDVGGGESQAGRGIAYNNVTILNNRFFNNHYAVRSEGIGRIEGNVMVGNYFGISGGGPAINNIVADNTYGISCGTVEGNFVANNKFGVMGYDINRNTLINNQVGVASGFSELHYNNIYGNALNVNYTLATDANATYNWWGTTDTQAIAQSIYDYEEDFMLGRVNFNPVLTALSPSAPSPDTQVPTVDSVDTAQSSPTPQPSVPELPGQMTPLLIVALSMVLLVGAAIIKRRKTLISSLNFLF